jgi:tetratricopeptide (TPR) repeat protein
MDTDLAQEAIAAALSGNWREAVKFNSQILKGSPQDTDALNRLARAYAETGKIAKAKTLSQKVLKIDPFNPIATKCLAKWKGLKKGQAENHKLSSAEAFLEEPGKTKLVSLLYPGDSKLLAKLDAGDEVKLNPHAHRVSILTLDGKYVGRLPDDLAARLRRLIKAGNQYKALIKSVDTKEIKVFIRELSRASGYEDTPSFSTEKIDYISFIPPELVHKKEEETPLTPEEE